MKIEQANGVFGHKITGGSEYCWRCWPNARYMDYENEHAHGSVVFSTSNQMVFEATVTPKDESMTPYRWLNPAWSGRMINEAKERDIDPQVAWDDVNWTDCEVWSDWAEKAEAIWAGEVPDSRIQVPVELSDSEFNRLAMEAHRQDITLNQLITNILQAEIDAHRALKDEGAEWDDHAVEWEDSGWTIDGQMDQEDPVTPQLQEELQRMKDVRDEFRELCLKPHEPQADDTSTSDIEHSHYWYDTDRNRA